jgi:ribonuclease HII
LAVHDEYRVGVDENGLGAWLGPLVVTAVLARVADRGQRVMAGELPPELGRDLDDSKRLVSHTDVRLAEAWARALVAPRVRSPSRLFQRLSLEGERHLRELCPAHVQAQCWTVDQEHFAAPSSLLERVMKHRRALESSGIQVLSVKTSLVCTKRLNLAREQRRNRIVVDLHAMEQLILALRKHARQELSGVCGKVGGIANYPRFFGPLAGRLHTVIEQSPARSAYYIPALGRLEFVRDADATDPLVMLASLVGKYIRELMMGRIAHYYAVACGDAFAPSGYHEPKTAEFVRATAAVRGERSIPDACFLRARDQVK